MDKQKHNDPDGGDFRQELLELKDCVEQALQALDLGEIEKAQDLIKDGLSAIPIKSLVVAPHNHTEPVKIPEGSRITEGVFDGQRMIGADGKQYLVPPNYASKSKLVEGDMMKLAITGAGAFVYKQIGPIARKRVFATLETDSEQMWVATDGVHQWKLLTAAVTYFKGKVGDEVIILVPRDAPSHWAAVDNIIAR